MNSLIIALASAVLYIVAYYTYGRYLSKRIFKINPLNKCPSHTHRDNCDFIPTPKFVLFGHHFTSIAGTGPIVGPAIAIIWGWIPALIWVLIGSIFMGAVHDFGSMMISLRHQGRSIGDIAGDLINHRVRILFMLIIFFALWIVIAIFGVVIASVFHIFPAAVIPVWLQIPIAIWLGHCVYAKQKSYFKSGLIAIAFMYISILIGIYIPVEIPNIGILNPVGFWVIILLIYAYIASTLPVSVLLQPRDYINAFQLVIAMVLLVLGIIVTQPDMIAPAYQSNPIGAPPIYPLLFITLACGAISGFHCLVASGTTSKQCDNEINAQGISYGGMLLEGFLAIIVIIACGAGLGLGLMKNGILITGYDAFQQQYGTWQSAQGLGSKINSFVAGSSNLIASIGIPINYAIALMGLFVAAFAATTLDTATRLQRYMVSEISKNCGNKFFIKKHPATSLAVISALLLAFSSGGGKGALALWPLFGAINQLLGGLALLVITVWLSKQKLPILFTALPMIFMLVMTAWAMNYNLSNFWINKNYLLMSIGFIVIIFQFWIMTEVVLIFFRSKKNENK